MKKLARVIQNSVVVSIGFLASFPQLVHAAVLTQPPSDTTTITLGNIEKWINVIKDTILIVGISIAVILIIWSGIMYMFAGGDPEKVGSAKTRFWNGVIGALIIIGVWLIISTLNTLITKGITTG